MRQNEINSLTLTYNKFNTPGQVSNKSRESNAG